MIEQAYLDLVEAENNYRAVMAPYSAAISEQEKLNTEAIVAIHEQYKPAVDAAKLALETARLGVIDGTDI